MQLVNMDVERHGSHARTQLGPFSAGLNAICGLKGSGKTTLLNWLRHITTVDGAHDSRSPAVPVAGQVELTSRGQHWQLPENRRGFTPHAYGSQTDNLSITQRDLFAALAAASGAADTEAALESVAKRFGLDNLAPQVDSGRDALLARQRDIEIRLQRLRTLESSRESLTVRRHELERELQDSQTTPASSVPGDRTVRYDGYPVEHRRYDDRFAIIEADLRDTLAHLEGLDRELAELRGELKVLEVTKASVTVDDSYRLQLQEIDDRLNRWRQTLRDLKAHRNRIDHDATDARLDKQVGEQLSNTKDPDPRGALRSLEAQILSARKQLDVLVDRYSVFQDVRPDHYAVHRDDHGRTRIAYHEAGHQLSDSNNLPETLRSMQKDLYEACQQLARHESRAASETLKQQSEQLQRCEAELLHSVEKLIEERAGLLRKIANEYQLSNEQLSLAFGNWCDCHDHNHLQDWLLNDSEVKTARVGHDPLVRQRLQDRIEAIEVERKAAEIRAENCKRQLRDAELYRRGFVERFVETRGRSLADIHRDMDVVHGELREWDDRERLLAEADEIRRLLAVPRPIVASASPFRDRVHRHIAGLMGGRGAWANHSNYRYVSENPQRRYDLVDGIVYDTAAHNGGTYNNRRVEAEVPAALVRVALRLAIAESVAARSEPVSLVFDESLDHVSPDLQQSAMAHLAQVTASGQQIIILTGDQRVADLVHGHRGWVGYLDRQTTATPDINRHLTALANDYEADKWYQPTSRREAPRTTPPVRGEYYLTERSRVEESPSIDALAASRCRAVGIDRIGDLLDVDPHWLAEQLRLDGVSEATVVSWQAEARLLCSVRQLRPFDARLLVAIGVRTPQQLANMHPSQLLDRVERFVATDRGRRLLRSGSSYELSRITTWIASAKGGAGRHGSSNFSDGQYERNSRHGNDNGHERGNISYRQNARNGHSTADYGRDAYRSVDRPVDRDTGSYDNHEVEFGDNQGYAYDRDYDDNTRTSRGNRDSSGRDSSGRINRAGSRRSSSLARRNRSTESQRSSSSRRSSQSGDREYPVLNGSESSRSRSRSESQREPRQPRAQHDESRRGNPLKLAQAEFSREDTQRLKFYLELASPVVDAPSIGPRMAARLEKLGILTVDQLLAANAESLADKLNMRRVDAATIRGWQEQARLVCRIPNLRGHDAQLLVACNLTSPEELANMNPAGVLTQVLVVAETGEGQRILRGGKQPDLEEVTDWINWASQCRSLNAA